MFDKSELVITKQADHTFARSLKSVNIQKSFSLALACMRAYSKSGVVVVMLVVMLVVIVVAMVVVGGK